MNYKELKEKASRGPFFVEPDNGWYNIRAIAKGKLGYAEYAVTNEGIPDEANARLIAHTLNTYDALLEALAFVDDQIEQAIADESIPFRNKGFIRGLQFSYSEALKDAQNVEGA